MARGKAAIGRYFKSNRLPKNHVKRLNELNKQIKDPMHPDCRMSIVIPAYKEGKSLKKSLGLLAKQETPKGRPINPNEYEILVMMNRPSATVDKEEAFGETRKAISEFRKTHPDVKIHPVEATFDFKRSGNGGYDVKMGQVFKTAADLALYRVNQRKGDSKLDEHLIMTTGADYEHRPKDYLYKMASAFQNPDVVMAKPEIDLPPESYKKMPFLHVTNKLFTNMINMYHHPDFNPNQNISERIPGEAVFRADTYVNAGGFNPDLRIAEDIDLAHRMGSIGRVVRHPALTVHTSPRRRIATLSRGGSLLNTYENFNKRSTLNKSAAMSDAELGKLDKKRLEDHMTQFYNFLLKRVYTQIGSTGDYEITDTKKQINYLKKAMKNPSKYKLNAQVIADMAHEEATREERLTNEDTRRNKYHRINALLSKKGGAGINDPVVNKQANRMLELMRQRLKIEREEAVEDARRYATHIFRTAAGTAGIDAINLRVPSQPLAKEEIAEHKVTIKDKDFNNLQKRIEKYNKGRIKDLDLFRRK